MARIAPVLLIMLVATGAVADQAEPILRDIVIEGNTKTDRSVVETVLG